MSFCDFCSCQQCQTGFDGKFFEYHAQTADNRWICFTCYKYDLCTADGPNRNWNGPCNEMNCLHRPIIVGDWIK